MLFRIGRDRNVEIPDLSDAFHQLGRTPIAFGMRNERLARTLGRVAAQRHDPGNAGILVAAHHIVDLAFRRTDAGQMRRRLQSSLAPYLPDHAQRAFARRASGTIGHRHEARMQRGEPVQALPEPFLHGVGLGRKELEGELQLRPAARFQAAKPLAVETRIHQLLLCAVSATRRHRHTVSPSASVLGKLVRLATLRSAARAQAAICASPSPSRRCA